jgi:hypothetical protein
MKTLMEFLRDGRTEYDGLWEKGQNLGFAFEGEGLMVLIILVCVSVLYYCNSVGGF